MSPDAQDHVSARPLTRSHVFRSVTLGFLTGTSRFLLLSAVICISAGVPATPALSAATTRGDADSVRSQAGSPWVALRAKVQILVESNLDQRSREATESTHYVLQTGTNTLFPSPQSRRLIERFAPGSDVLVSGKRSAKGFEIRRIRRVAPNPGEATAATATTAAGNPRILVILSSPSREVDHWRRLIFSPTAFTDAYCSSPCFSTRMLVERQSAGAQTISGDVVGPFAVTDTAGCSSLSQQRELYQAAQQQGIDLNAYSQVVVATQETQSTCGFAGRATLGYVVVRGPSGSLSQEATTWGSGARSIELSRTSRTAETVFHELGHSLGLQHAGSLDCYADNGSVRPVAAPLGRSGIQGCEIDETGDRFDSMGYSWFSSRQGPFNPRYLRFIGSIGPTQSRMVTAPGRYWVGAPLDASAATKELVVPVDVEPGGKVNWYVSVEAPRPLSDTAFGAPAFGMSGVSFRLFRRMKVYGQGKTICVPDPARGDYECPWTVGTVLNSDYYGLTIRIESATTGGAWINVERVRDSRDTEPPPRPQVPTTFQDSSYNLKQASISWDSVEDNVKLKSYRVYRDEKLVEEIEAWNCDYGTWTQFYYVCNNKPELRIGLKRYTLESTRDEIEWSSTFGKLNHAQLFWTDSSPGLSGRHVYQVQAVDMAGNESALSEPSVVDRGASDGGTGGDDEDPVAAPRRVSLSRIKWRTRKHQPTVDVTLVAPTQVALQLSGRKGSVAKKGTCRRSQRSARCTVKLKKGRWKLQLRGSRSGWEPATYRRTLTIRP